VIEAIQWNGDITSIDDFLPLQRNIDKPVESPFYWDAPELKIKTLEGLMHVSLGDWIIQGVKGEFYPCKPDIFESTYEKV